MCEGIDIQYVPSPLNNVWMLYIDVSYLVLVLESSEDALVLHQSPTTKSKYISNTINKSLSKIKVCFNLKSTKLRSQLFSLLQDQIFPGWLWHFCIFPSPSPLLAGTREHPQFNGNLF